MFVGLYTGRCSCWSSWQLQRYCTVHCTSRSRTLLELTVECGLSIINLSPLTRSSTTLPNTVPHVFYFYKPCIVLYPFRKSTLLKMPSPLSRYHTTFIMTQCCRICHYCVMLNQYKNRYVQIHADIFSIMYLSQTLHLCRINQMFSIINSSSK